MGSKEPSNSERKNYLKITAFGVFLCLFGFALYLISPNLIARRFRSELVFNNGTSNSRTQMYTTWSPNDTKNSLKVYFFEILNARDVVNGKQGFVQEIGPYHFDILRDKRINGYSSSDDTLQFEEFKSYRFNEHLSMGTLDDKLTVINVPIVALSASLTNFVNRFPLSIVTRPILSAVLQGILQIHQQYFATKQSVRQLMFQGYRVNVFNTITALTAPLRLIGFRVPIPKLVNNSYGLYLGRNNSIDGPYDVFAGVNDPTKTANIKSWRDRSSLNYWTHTTCNSINGTYGTQFAPNVQKADTLYVFIPEICRSVSLIYQNDSNVNSIKTYRFVLANDVFRSSNSNADNWCFCANARTPKTCEIDGAIDVSNCKRGAPIMVSNPHYLYSSNELRDVVAGIAPDVDKHLTYFDIEPISGAVLRSKKRFGLSIYVQRFPTLNILRRSLKNTVLPLAWFEESTEINEKETEEFQQLFQPVQVADVAVNALLISGVSLIVVTILFQCCRRKKEDIDEKTTIEPVKIIEKDVDKEIGCCSRMFCKSKKKEKKVEKKKPLSATLENKIRPVMDSLFPIEPEKIENKEIIDEKQPGDKQLDEYWDEFSVNSRDFDRHSIVTTIQRNSENTNGLPPIEATDQLSNKPVVNSDVQTGSLAISKKILANNNKNLSNPLKKQKSNDSIIERRSLNGIDYRGITVAEAIDILEEKFGS